MLDFGRNKIQKAKAYASEPERIHFQSLAVAFEGRNGSHSVGFEEGSGRWDRDYFGRSATCSHTMGMERVLGVRAPNVTP